MSPQEYWTMIKQAEQQLLDYIKSNNLICLSEFCISSKAYDGLKPFAKNMIERLEKGNRVYCRLLFLFVLVQFTMREFQGEDFYNELYRSLNYHPNCSLQVIDKKLRKLNKKTFLDFNLLTFDCFSNNLQGSVECIKSHAFVPFWALNNFFDFLFSFYKSLGCHIPILAKDLEIPFLDLSNIIKSNETTTDPQLGNSGLYLLKKCTKRVLGRDDSSSYALFETFLFPCLQMIDNWYYMDDYHKIDTQKIDWLSTEFDKWKQLHNQTTTTNKLESRFHNRNPYFKYHKETGRLQLVIPSNTIRGNDISDYEYYYSLPWIDKPIKVCPTIQLSEYDYYLIDEMCVPVSSPEIVFNKIAIVLYREPKNNTEPDCIDNLTTRYIKASDYRLFDSSGNMLNKPKCGNIALITKENCVVTVTGEEKTATRCANWLLFNLIWEKSTYCKINDIILSIDGVVSKKPFFEDELTDLFSTDPKITITRSHPIVYLVCTKEEYQNEQFHLSINDNNIRINKDKLTNVRDPDDEQKVIVGFDIASIIDEKHLQDNRYKVKLGICNQPYQIESEYLLLNSFRYRFKEARFYYNQCHFYVRKDEINCQFPENFTRYPEGDRIVSYDDGYYNSECYITTINPQDPSIIFNIFGINVQAPINKAIYSYSLNDDGCCFFRDNNNQKREVWYSDFGNWHGDTLYVTISGALALEARYNGIVISGEPVSTNSSGQFRLDLSQGLLEEIEKNTCRECTDFEIHYYDNKKRYFSLFSIRRTAHFSPFKIEDTLKNENGIVYYSLNELIPAETNLLGLRIYNCKNEMVLDKTIRIGSNELKDIKVNTSYKWERYIIEKAVWGDDKETIIRDAKGKSRFDHFLLDESRLDGVSFIIYQIQVNGNILPIKRNYKYKVKLLSFCDQVWQSELYENDVYLGIVFITELNLKRHHGLQGFSYYFKMETTNNNDISYDYYSRRLSLDPDGNTPLYIKETNYIIDYRYICKEN